MKRTPEITSASFSDPVILRQDFPASTPSWNIIAMAVSLENDPLTEAVRWRRVAKVDSMAFVVRAWDQ